MNTSTSIIPEQTTTVSHHARGNNPTRIVLSTTGAMSLLIIVVIIISKVYSNRKTKENNTADGRTDANMSSVYSIYLPDGAFTSSNYEQSDQGSLCLQDFTFRTREQSSIQSYNNQVSRACIERYTNEQQQRSLFSRNFAKFQGFSYADHLLDSSYSRRHRSVTDRSSSLESNGSLTESENGTVDPRYFSLDRTSPEMYISQTETESESEQDIGYQNMISRLLETNSIHVERESGQDTIMDQRHLNPFSRFLETNGTHSEDGAFGLTYTIRSTNTNSSETDRESEQNTTFDQQHQNMPSTTECHESVDLNDSIFHGDERRRLSDNSLASNDTTSCDEMNQYLDFIQSYDTLSDNSFESNSSQGWGNSNFTFETRRLPVYQSNKSTGSKISRAA